MSVTRKSSGLPSWIHVPLLAETAMRGVTAEDIQRVCKKYIQNIDFVMLGDPSLWMDPLAADKPKTGSDLN